MEDKDKQLAFGRGLSTQFKFIIWGMECVETVFYR